MAKQDYVNPSYRRPDHPSFKEKKHTLLIDSQGASNKTIKTESGTLRFENGVAVLPDDTRARDIYDELQGSKDPSVRALHPNQYSLVEDKPTVNPDSIHRYTFGYSRAFASAWERVFENDKDDLENKEEDNGKGTISNTEHSTSDIHAGT